MAEELKQTIASVEVTSLRPDGEPLDQWDVADCLTQLALGFYHRWDPMPPDWWLRPRRAWNMYVRAVLDEHLPGFDSPSQIVNALDAWNRSIPEQEQRLPPAPHEGAELLRGWREVRDKFLPNPVPVWLDRGILPQAIEHGGKGCLIWAKFRAIGHEFERLGLRYFGAGTSPSNAMGETIALSIPAHGTGKNLQAWSRSLVLTPPANADAWEQLIGRTHRMGQKADTVQVSVIGSIDYHGAALGRVLSEARASSKAAGFTHKLVAADWT